MSNLKDKFKLIKKESKEYPLRLTDLPDSPKEISMAGNFLPADNLSVAVVGSRKISAYGRDVCEYLVSELSPLGITIVSGLMYGVDMQAHETAMKYNGRTLGLLGFGIDYLYKVQNQKVLEYMILSDKGAVISEYAPIEAGSKWTFPKRDRLIAGLALAVIVIEAAERSGTSYTVSMALEMGKEVFAVPGSIFSETSKGTNNMIKDGANIVTGVEDILNVLNIEQSKNKIVGATELPASSEEANILSVIDYTGVYIDEICQKSKLPVGLISSLLTTMELKGMVKNVGGGFYRRV